VNHWIIEAVIAIVIIGVLTALILWGRQRQKDFDAQYDAMKKQQDVFVLQKLVLWERPPESKIPMLKVKTYKVVGRMNLSQSVKGMDYSRMQTVVLQTTKREYKKLKPNHRYKMEIAGTFIGKVDGSAR
jgi:hypothetical protein